MSQSLKADCSAALCRAVVERFDWDHESQMLEAYRELLPVIRAGIEAYDHFLAMHRRRLRPLARPAEGTHATE